ncbi:MAG: hypothetical protein PHR77_09000 [Kiritimatiellae bacterium]|nr:hypothetical protein [Kiritimatiellia bacterium]MDD5522879.1 hypothetical protein [Kiritimatiellia bacterium]
MSLRLSDSKVIVVNFPVKVTFEEVCFGGGKSYRAPIFRIAIKSIEEVAITTQELRSIMDAETSHACRIAITKVSNLFIESLKNNFYEIPKVAVFLQHKHINNKISFVFMSQMN